MRHPYHLVPDNNRSKFIRRFIVGIQVLALVLTLATTLFNDGAEESQPATQTQNDAASADRNIGVYVDGAFRVHVMDAGVSHQHSTFARCGDGRTVSLEHTLADTTIEKAIPSWVAYPQLGVEFTAGDYYIISSDTRFQMHFENGDRLVLTLHCPANR